MRNLQNIEQRYQLSALIIADQAQIAMFWRQKAEQRRCENWYSFISELGEKKKNRLDCPKNIKVKRDAQNLCFRTLFVEWLIKN